MNTNGYGVLLLLGLLSSAVGCEREHTEPRADASSAMDSASLDTAPSDVGSDGTVDATLEDVGSDADAVVDTTSPIDASADTTSPIDASADTTSGMDAPADTASAVDAPADTASAVDAPADTAPTCTKTLCGTECVDLSTSPNHCGACGYAVVHGRTCVGGKPTPAWQPIATTGGPGARMGHAAAFVGGKLVITGGATTYTDPVLATGAAYDPVSDTWSSIAPMKSPRCFHAAAASPTRGYVFGGLSDCTDGSAHGALLESFDPSTKDWTVAPSTGAPASRYNTAMIWTGADLLVYGGSADSPFLATGGVFDPTSAKWTDASCTLTSCERAAPILFLEGGAARVMGGVGGGAPAGLQRTASSGAWSAWSAPSTSLLGLHVADDGRRLYLLIEPVACDPPQVQIYDRKSGTFLPADASVPPTGLLADAAVAWSGSELLAWSGACGMTGGTPADVGGRYQPPAP